MGYGRLGKLKNQIQQDQDQVLRDGVSYFFLTVLIFRRGQKSWSILKVIEKKEGSVFEYANNLSI